ncbi:MAG: DUF488 domain-containing protein [Lachnospiraceae bacterium]|nr:DUF488 domain-containing protein [Lachnospiraceae bacterium]
MIYLCDFEKIDVGVYDEVWLITRRNKEIKLGMRLEQELAPSSELLDVYLDLRDNGQWNREAFDSIYVPAFIREISENTKAGRLLQELCSKDLEGKSICLVCYCEDETMCHRSIVAGVLMGKGAKVIADADYLKYYALYEKCRKDAE